MLREEDQSARFTSKEPPRAVNLCGVTGLTEHYKKYLVYAEIVTKIWNYYVVV